MGIFARAFLTLAISYPTFGLSQSCSDTVYPVVTDDDYEHALWVRSAEPGDILIDQGGFVASFDGPDDDDADASTLDLLAIPEWVAHEVKRYEEDGRFTYAAGFKRPRPWYEDVRTDFLDAQAGVTEGRMDRSYSGEGHIWNRGHLATRSLVNRYSAEAGCNSHVFFNAVPQFGPMNSGPWLALERYTGALANKYGRAWAINGPIFYDGLEIETIGGAGEIPVAIPHALFKVIIFEIDDEIYVRAFSFPQPTYQRIRVVMIANGGRVPDMGFQSCDRTDQDEYDFTEFKSSLDEIEQLTNIEFFPGTPPGEKAALNEFSQRDIWTVEDRFYALSCG